MTSYRNRFRVKQLYSSDFFSLIAGVLKSESEASPVNSSASAGLNKRKPKKKLTKKVAKEPSKSTDVVQAKSSRMYHMIDRIPILFPLFFVFVLQCLAECCSMRFVECCWLFCCSLFTCVHLCPTFLQFLRFYITHFFL